MAWALASLFMLPEKEEVDLLLSLVIWMTRLGPPFWRLTTRRVVLPSWVTSSSWPRPPPELLVPPLEDMVLVTDAVVDG